MKLFFSWSGAIRCAGCWLWIFELIRKLIILWHGACGESTVGYHLPHWMWIVLLGERLWRHETKSWNWRHYIDAFSNIIAWILFCALPDRMKVYRSQPTSNSMFDAINLIETFIVKQIVPINHGPRKASSSLLFALSFRRRAMCGSL